MKKSVLALIVVCIALILTGCACKHESTGVVGYQDADCITEGFTGNTVCHECEEVVTAGEVIPAAGHTAGAPRGVIEAACYQEGYTGDVYCTVCDTMLTAGEVIPTAEHTAGEPQGVTEAACYQEGYTGDVYCTVCYELLTAGEVIPMTDHIEGEPKYAADPTCTVPGFTGTVYCMNCSFCFVQGEDIPATGHTEGVREGAIEATCTSNGYTGDTACTVCGEAMPGEKTPRAEHAYADNICADCGWMTPGLYVGGSMLFTWDEVVEKGFVDLREIDGGYRLEECEDISGLLVIDESVIETDSNALSNTTLTGVWIPATCTKVGANLFRGSDSLQECVFFCDLEVLPQGTFYMCPNLTSVVLPETITKIEDWAFLGCEKLPEITIPESVTYIGGDAFKYCHELESIVIPDGVTYIGGTAFKDCSGLTYIDMPASLERIGDKCFEGCKKLGSIELPEGMVYVGEYAFRDTAITELVFPSTMERILCQGSTQSLVTVDMSAMTVDTMDTVVLFNYCLNLETVIMPPNMISFYDYWFDDCAKLSKLVLPEILMSVDDNNELTDCDALTELVWPVTLNDGSAFADLPNLTTIYYRGTEAQWNATASSDLFEGVEIVFEYTGE